MNDKGEGRLLSNEVALRATVIDDGFLPSNCYMKLPSADDIRRLRAGDEVAVSEYHGDGHGWYQGLVVRIEQRDGDIFYGRVTKDGSPVAFHALNISDVLKDGELGNNATIRE